MRTTTWLVAACLVSCLAAGCGDDDDHASPGTAGSAGMAGEPMTGDAGTSSGTSGGSNGGSGTAGTTSMGGEATTIPEGGAGGAAETAQGFTAFVHDLVQNQTEENNAPAALKPFSDPTDDHGHYLAPAGDFDDLF